MCLVSLFSVNGQTNNTAIADVKIQRLEDLYYLTIYSKPTMDVRLSGRVLFDNDHFGLTVRVISYPALKILF